jgi:hypothetical protein
MNGLTVATLMAMAGVVAWGLTMVHASARLSRLQDEMSRLEQRTRAEIQHWRDEAARARTRAAQVARDSEAWAAGCKQGRDDVITVVPLLIAAQEHGRDDHARSQHGVQEATPNP